MTHEEQHARASAPVADRQRESLRDWYRRQPGQWLLDFERQALDDVLSCLFGYYLVQVGAGMDDYLLGASRIRNHIIVDRDWPLNLPETEHARICGFYGNADQLPLQNDSVDVVVLPHTLEFEGSPHQVLREVERVLVPEGHAVILGFNPWSLWGSRRLLGRWRRQAPPWHGAFRSAMRIRDWLALLGFDIVTTRYGFFRPPLQGKGIMRRLNWVEGLGTRWWPYLGGVYIIVARKQVVKLMPIKPRWRPRRSLLRPDLPRPTT